MGRRRALMHGGVSAITVGNVAIAISVAAMLAAAPRLLTSAAFVGLSLAWTLTTVFGYGLAMPTEQLVTRRRSARDGSPIGRPVALLAIAGSLSLLALIVIGGLALEVDERPVTVGAAVTGIVGWVLLAPGRGRVAGSGRLHTYAGLLVVEAATRILMVVAAIAFPSGSTWLLGGAVGGPILVSAVVSLVGRPSRIPERLAAVRHRSRTGQARDPEQATFVLVAAGYQLCLNAAPLVLAWRLDREANAAVGAFVITSSYYRLAAVLGAGFATQSLVTLSSMWSDRRYPEFREGLNRAVAGATGVTAVATLCAAAAGPIAVPLLNGRDPDIPWVVLAALAISTVLATAAAVCTSGLMASHRGGAAAAWWLTGAAAHLALLSTASSIGDTVALALVAGPAIVLAGVLATARRVPHESTRPGQEDAG